MVETRKDVSNEEAKKLMNMKLIDVLTHLVQINNAHKTELTGFMMETQTHHIDLLVRRKQISKGN